MARRILALDAGRNAILTDNAHTYGVMLATGRPDLFLDRIDVSDVRWSQVAAAPRGRVRYLLVNLNPSRYDLLIERYPALRTGDGLPSHVTSVFDNGAFALYAVDE
jgi:hypothetical protein